MHENSGNIENFIVNVDQVIDVIVWQLCQKWGLRAVLDLGLRVFHCRVGGEGDLKRDSDSRGGTAHFDHSIKSKNPRRVGKISFCV